MKFTSAFAGAALVLAPLAAQAGRPMTTDDATVLDPHTCQLEAWWQHLPDRQEAWLAPSCGIGAGWEAGAALVRTRTPGGAAAFQTGSQTGSQAGLPTGTSPSSSTGASTSTSTRLGSLYAKTVVRPLETDGWGLGLVLSQTPQASGSMAGDTSLNIPLSVSLAGDAVLVHANAGWTRHYAIRHGGATWALGMEVAAGPRAAVTLETYGSAHDHSYLQAGARYSVIPRRLDVDASYGERLTARGRQRYFAIGLTLLASLAK